MVKTDFDNLMKIFRASHTRNGNLTVSTEVDLELPRGYIAKIAKIIFAVSEDALEALLGESATTTAAFTLDVRMALVRDPDDTNTDEIPSNVVEHDVIGDMKFAIGVDHDAVGTLQGTQTMTSSRKEVNFVSEGLDVVTARNMRFNSDADVNDFVGEPNVEVEIHYTLERVTDIDILNLLDIL